MNAKDTGSVDCRVRVIGCVVCGIIVALIDPPRRPVLGMLMFMLFRTNVKETSNSGSEEHKLRSLAES